MLNAGVLQMLDGHLEFDLRRRRLGWCEVGSSVDQFVTFAKVCSSLFDCDIVVAATVID